MKKRFKCLLSLIFVLILCMTTSITSYALDWNGASSGSSGGGTASNGYAVSTNGSALAGFRFSLVSNDGSLQYGNSVDIFTTTSYTASNRKLTNKYSKAYWVRNYTSTTSIATTTSTTNCYQQSSAGFATTLPVISSLTDIDNLASNLNTWQKNTVNINAILKLIGSSKYSSLNDMANEKIIIEPILTCALKGNVRHYLTLTELAIYGGGYVYNGDWTAGTAGSNDSGSFTYITKYTNWYFANYMYTPTATCGWSAASSLSARTSFKNIITSGYGANVLSKSDIVTTTYLTVNYYSNYATTAFSDTLNAVGSSKNVLVRTYKFASNTAYPNGLHNYSKSGDGTYLARTGYTATGYWGTATSGGTLVSQSTGFTNGVAVAKAFGKDITSANATVNVYAQWTPNTYTVTYNANGGTGAPAAQTKTHGVDLLMSSTKPTRTGYTFKCWNTKADGSGWDKQPGDYYYSDADGVLYAQWTPNTYTVKYNGNGNTGGSTANSTHTYDVAKALTANGYTRTGYTFKNWNTKADGTGTTYTNQQSVKNLTATNGGTVTLYAQWTINTYTNTISHWTWGFKNSEGNNSTKNAYHLGNTTFTKTYGATFVLNDTQKTTIPNGFYIETDFGTSSISGTWAGYDFGTTVTQKAANMSFEYDYKPYSYKITYDLDGGNNNSANPSTYNVLYGVTLQNPTKEGYTFAGWYLNDKKVTGINPGANATFSSASDMYSKLASRTTGDVTLVAKWTPNKYTISYNANEGKGAPAAQTKTHGVTLTLSSTKPTRTGFAFTGWNTMANGTGTTYAPGASYAENKDITLYAQWKKTVDIQLAGTANTTIMVGDVFDPLEHIDDFEIADDKVIAVVEVIYNGVPRDAENKATTTGAGYTVVYYISFADGTIGDYRLIVTVLDEEMIKPKLIGYIRFIAFKYLDTLEPNSKWRVGELKERLYNTLSVQEPTDDDAEEVWRFSPNDVQDIKNWVKENEKNGVSRQEQNALFGSVFGKCQTKGKYADERKK